MGEPKRPWIKLQLAESAGTREWSDLLSDLDAWLRNRGDGTTIYDVQPVRDDPPRVPIDRRSGFDRRTC